MLANSGNVPIIPERGHGGLAYRLIAVVEQSQFISCQCR